MSWYALSDLEDEPRPANVDPETYERVMAVKRMARKMMDMYKKGHWHPEVTARKSMELSEQLKDAVQPVSDTDDGEDPFTPAQRAELRRLAGKLRRFARALTMHHEHGPQGVRLTLAPRGRYGEQWQHGRERERQPEPERPMPMRRLRYGGPRMRPDDHGMVRELPERRNRLTALPISGWEADEDDHELGFLPALAPILGAVAGPLLGGLFGGDKKSAPAPAPAPAQPQVVLGGATGGPASDVSLPSIGGVVADQIRAVPPPVRQQVTDAIREAMDRYKSGQTDVTQLMSQISTMLGPNLKAQLEAVNQAALQRQATYEHESLNRANQRWEDNSKAQAAILSRIDGMEKTLGAAVQTKAQRMNAVARAFGVPPRYQE